MGETEKRYLETAIADDDIVYGATQIFDALSDFTRFQILCALSIQDRSVGELQEFCHVSQSAISHQLRLLKDRGIVASSAMGSGWSTRSTTTMWQRSSRSVSSMQAITAAKAMTEKTPSRKRRPRQEA